MDEGIRIPHVWREWWNERAAILEYDAHLSRVEAEKEATRLLIEYLQQKGAISGLHP